MLVILLTLIVTGISDACEHDGNGVYVAGMDRFFDCKYLALYLVEDKYIGIFQNKVDYCRMPTTDCCTTCHDVLSCQDAQTNGIYLAETYYDCKYLRQYHDEDKFIGIYKNRLSVCSFGTTDCCESCKQVHAEDGNSHTSDKTTSTQPTTSAPQTPAGSSVSQGLRDECVDSCLWIADSSYGKCEWLLDPTRTVYNQRLYLCNNGFAPGCKRTCADIYMENTPTGATKSTKESTAITPTTIVSNDRRTTTPEATSTSAINSETETTTPTTNVQLSKVYDMLKHNSEELRKQDEANSRSMNVIFAIFRKLGLLKNP